MSLRGVGSVHDGDMVTLLNEPELTTLEQVRCFLDGTEAVAFEILGEDERTLGPRN